MKIHVREIEASPFKEGFIRLSADIEYDDNHAAETIWFDVEEKYKEKVSISGNPWVTCLLPLASSLGENIEIDKPCDYQLLVNLQEVMSVWNSWDAKLSIITICSPIQMNVVSKSPSTAAFFSGGVDSFFTALTVDEEARQGKVKPLTDLILVWGFDIPLENTSAFEKLYKRLEKSTILLNKSLLPVITNIRQTRFEITSWGTHSHVGALGAVAHVFAGAFSKVYLGSSYPYKALVTPWGSHPMIDHLLSSSCMEIFTHGLPKNRVEKTKFISKFNIAMGGLHVCWQDASDKNCGRCDKCYRTMITLQLLNGLDGCSTFTQKVVTEDEMGRLYCSSDSSIMFLDEIVSFALSKGDLEVVEAVSKSIRNSRRINKILPFVNILRNNWPFRRIGVFLYKATFKNLIYR